MFNHAPQENPKVSWLWVAVWSIIIFLTIPFARTIQKFVSGSVGRQAFFYGVVVFIVLTAVAAIVYLIRHRLRRPLNYVWLILVSAVFIYYTAKLRQNPEEAVHFIQYGVLGVLIYRALCHKIRDKTIYLAAALIGGLIGMADEFIQWLTPKRFWDLRDIWLNFFGVGLTQVGIALGLSPRLISDKITLRNWQALVKLAAFFFFLLGINLLSTPVRLQWIADRVEFLSFLARNETTMIEYGHLFYDRKIGLFQSRLSRPELKQTDADRGEQSAKLLNAYPDSLYGEFLEKYTPVSDPFLHEARVHLFRRDRYLRKAKALKPGEYEYHYRFTVAHYENIIMQKYFNNTFKNSSYILSPEDISLMQQNILPDYIYHSAVSYGLIVKISENQVFLTVFSTLLLLGSIYLLLNVRKRRSEVTV